MKINKILLPNKPQLDAIVALYLIGQYGRDKFSGIEDAGIVFWEKSSDPTNEEIAKFQEEGILPIEVGGGILDHHNKEQGNHETATSLTVAYLGIEKKPELSALINYVREDDLEGLHNKFGDFVHIIKNMYKQNIKSEKVVEFVLQILHVMQTNQIAWHHTTREEFEKKCKIYKFKKYKRRIKIGVIESDNIQIANFAISAKNISIVIQKRSTGHIVILTNKHYRIDLRESIAAIRKRELELRGYDKAIEINKLKYEGKSMLIPNWFYHRSLNAFMNGSDALNNTEATQVPLNEIIQFIVYGTTSEESEKCDCGTGENNCPYRDYGFSKCKQKIKNN